MDRAEATGLGVAVAGHALLIGVGFAGERLPPIVNPPIEVAFVNEVSLQSTAPKPSVIAPAPLVGPDNSPPAPTPPEASSTQTVPSKSLPMPKPQFVPPKQSPTPTKSPGKSGSNRKPFDLNLPDPSESESASPPAQTASAAVRASLGAEVRRQLKPHWRAPTGADAEQLRTELAISLGRNGAVIDIEVVRTTGQTASNRPQVRLHQEQAIRAVRLAAPFRLPAEFYDAWKALTVSFDKRL